MSDRISAAIKLKNAKMPVAGVLMFLLAIAGDVHDTFFDHTEDEAKVQADKSNEQAWKAVWESFEAKERLNLFAAEAQARIAHLEEKAATSERNVESLENTIKLMLLQDRDNRNTPPPQIRHAVVPKELKPDPVEKCVPGDPLCGDVDVSHALVPVPQQVAPMPSINDMWKEKKAAKKEEFRAKFAK